MPITRRDAIRVLSAAAPALRPRWAAAAAAGLEIERGPFVGTRQSLSDYRIPEWFQNAKFGIWAHWGPQSAPEYGDWYARNMYLQGSRQYKYHLQRYGHPSKFGYKDVIPTWKAERFDADYLVGLYRKAGAKYFVSMGVHHDNFDMWDSRHQRWNAVNMGAKRDIVGLFRQAAIKNDLKFGVSEHLWPSYSWFAVAKGHDTSGPLTGVPYDGHDPKYWDLYGSRPDIPQRPFELNGVPEEWKQTWFRRIKDLVDRYQPDLLYTDGGIPFEEYGLNQVANLYNLSAKRHRGAVEAVYTSKRRADCESGTCALDLERGIVDAIWPSPWQTDTCVGHWHYDKEAKYKTPKTVIDMLVDIVSRNGNLLLNFPLRSGGTLDDAEHRIVSSITDWMQVNSEAIYGTRPWKIYGTDAQAPKPATLGKELSFNERNRRELTAGDVRFTQKGKTLFAFVMGWPEKEALIQALAANSPHRPDRIRNVELLGHKGKLRWVQDDTGLKVQMPAERPCEHAIVFKIATA